MPPKYQLQFLQVQPVVFKSTTDPRNPKYNLMIKSRCRKCNTFMGAMAHTEDMMKYLETVLNLSLEEFDQKWEKKYGLISS